MTLARYSKLVIKQKCNNHEKAIINHNNTDKQDVTVVNYCLFTIFANFDLSLLTHLLLYAAACYRPGLYFYAGMQKIISLTRVVINPTNCNYSCNILRFQHSCTKIVDNFRLLSYLVLTMVTVGLLGQR